MNMRAMITSGTLALSAVAFAAGCKTTAPAPTEDEPAIAQTEPTAITVDLSNVTALELQATAAAEMGGPTDYTLTRVTSADDLPAAVVEQGLEVDFEVHDVVLVGMGEQPSSGYGVEITGVQQVGSTVYVQASFTHPAPDDAVAQVVTAPWSAAAIDKLKPGVMLLSDFD